MSTSQFLKNMNYRLAAYKAVTGKNNSAIAQDFGISKQTVNRLINGKIDLSDKIGEKIIEGWKRLPIGTRAKTNHLADGLRESQPDKLGKIANKLKKDESERKRLIKISELQRNMENDRRLRKGSPPLEFSSPD